MAKFETRKLSDSLVEHTISGTNWTIQEWIDNKDRLFTVRNTFTDINDLFYVDMPEQYKTMDSALDAIQEFLHLNDYFEPDIRYCEDEIETYQKANLTYMK